MKKFFIGLVAAALMFGGLVATTATPANAGPYTGTVKSETDVKKPKKALKNKARLRVVLDAKSGNPKGQIVFTFVNKKTGKTKTFVRGAAKGPNFKFKGLKKGKYNVQVKYKPRKGSKWKPSSDSVKNVKVK